MRAGRKSERSVKNSELVPFPPLFFLPLPLGLETLLCFLHVKYLFSNILLSRYDMLAEVLEGEQIIGKKEANNSISGSPSYRLPRPPLSRPTLPPQSVVHMSTLVARDPGSLQRKGFKRERENSKRR
ncbi:hypothetical protein TNIN_92621 [Trichonephila inaurata madagascariensis]|uniref:Uncharacterized protein n=1 Tax=Trichonephila inaurata madagascariensis TaxID=2747483 RepID=A0A8X6XY57_9ARAC|nr:hypothetical protein TNIN_92621 [Trichonephila inaurata madagascariensis]